MKFLLEYLKNLLVSARIEVTIADWVAILTLVFTTLFVIFLIDFIIRKVIRLIFNRIASKTKTDFDDIMVKNKVPRNIAHIFPLILTYKTIPNIFFEHIALQNFLEKFILVVGIFFIVWGINSIFTSFKDFFKSQQRLKDKPIDSYIQVIMIFVWLTGTFAVFAVVSGITFWEFLAGLGTVSAVVILVFKDTILGFVASIQVSVNDMVRIGDWITSTKYGADGDVINLSSSSISACMLLVRADQDVVLSQWSIFVKAYLIGMCRRI